MSLWSSIGLLYLDGHVLVKIRKLFRYYLIKWVFCALNLHFFNFGCTGDVAVWSFKCVPKVLYALSILLLVPLSDYNISKNSPSSSGILSSAWCRLFLRLSTNCFFIFSCKLSNWFFFKISSSFLNFSFICCIIQISCNCLSIFCWISLSFFNIILLYFSSGTFIHFDIFGICYWRTMHFRCSITLFSHIPFVPILRFMYLVKWIFLLLLWDSLGKRLLPENASWGIHLLCNVEFISSCIP